MENCNDSALYVKMEQNTVLRVQQFQKELLQITGQNWDFDTVVNWIVTYVPLLPRKSDLKKKYKYRG